jgi:hypothetical protein
MFVNGSDETRKTMMYASSQAKYQDELDYPWDCRRRKLHKAKAWKAPPDGHLQGICLKIGYRRGLQVFRMKENATLKAESVSGGPPERSEES